MDPLLSEGSETLKLKSFFYHNVKENLTLHTKKNQIQKIFEKKLL